MLLGLPLVVAAVLLRPELWVISAGWIALVGGLMLLDAMIGPAIRAFRVDVDAPAILYAGGHDPLPVVFSFARGALPRRMEVQLETNELLEDIPVHAHPIAQIKVSRACAAGTPGSGPTTSP